MDRPPRDRPKKTAAAAVLALLVAAPAVLATEIPISLRHQGLPRRCVLHVPESLPAGPRPLVLMLHGAGGSSETAIAGSNWERQADEDGFLAAFPEALPPNPRRPPAFLANPRYWNDGKGRGRDWHNTVDDVGFLSRLIGRIAGSYPVDRRRVYVTGFSSGGAMAFRAGIELSREIAAIGPVAGQFWESGKRPERPVPAIFVIGTADPINPWRGGRQKSVWGVSEIKPPARDIARRYARAIGIRAAGSEISSAGGVRVVRYADSRQGAEVLEYAVAGQGHVWPGGTTTVPERIVGRDVGRLDATAVIWRFFREMALPPAPGQGTGGFRPVK